MKMNKSGRNTYGKTEKLFGKGSGLYLLFVVTDVGTVHVAPTIAV